MLLLKYKIDSKSNTSQANKLVIIRKRTLETNLQLKYNIIINLVYGLNLILQNFTFYECNQAFYNSVLIKDALMLK